MKKNLFFMKVIRCLSQSSDVNTFFSIMESKF